MKIALLQTRVYRDKADNLKEAAEKAAFAAMQGAEFAILPEMFNCPYETKCFPLFAEERGGESWQALSAMARENHLVLIGGSVPEREGDRLYNTSFVFGPDGEELAYHRKAHLFDIDIVGKQRFCESDSFTPGEKATLFEADGHTFGLAICFDIRFPELFRKMALEGAEAVFVPAAFNMTTGPMHWELSFRMRAVDNQLFTIGCAPARDRTGRYVSYANSLVCDPWGKVLANAGEEPGVTLCDIDLNEILSVRQQLPILSARRPEIY